MPKNLMVIFDLHLKKLKKDTSRFKQGKIDEEEFLDDLSFLIYEFEKFRDEMKSKL